MKKLLGILFCFAFLLIAGMVGAQSVPKLGKEVAEQKAVVSCACADVQVDEALDVQSLECSQKSFRIDIYKLRQASKQAAAKASEALFYRYSTVLQYSVTYIGRQGKQYHNHYSFCVICKCNQPPNYDI